MGSRSSVLDYVYLKAKTQIHFFNSLKKLKSSLLKVKFGNKHKHILLKVS